MAGRRGAYDVVGSWIHIWLTKEYSVDEKASNPAHRHEGRTHIVRNMGTARTALMILMAVARACGLLLPGPMTTVSARPQASRTPEAMASLPQLADRMAAMRKIPGRLLAGLSASVTGLRAKRDGSSCDLLFDDEEHAATWYV